MATLVPKNPRWVGGPPLEEAPIAVRAANSKTWKAGQWGQFASGVAQPLITGDTVVQLVFLDDQTSSTSSSDVRIARMRRGMQFEMYELSSTLANANRGESYGVDVSNNVLTLSKSDGSNLLVKIKKLATEYDPERNISADVKARCIVQVLTSAVEG